MKLLIATIALFMCSKLYAGWAIGGSSGKTLAPDSELSLSQKDLTSILVEASVNGSITVREGDAKVKLVPANYDFEKQVLSLKDANNGHTLFFKAAGETGVMDIEKELERPVPVLHN